MCTHVTTTEREQMLAEIDQALARLARLREPSPPEFIRRRARNRAWNKRVAAILRANDVAIGDVWQQATRLRDEGWTADQAGLSLVLDARQGV